MNLRIDHAQPSDAPIIAQMVGELLREITAMVGTSVFGFHQEETEARARSWMADGKYNVLLARDGVQPESLGFLALYESFGLYTEGTFGTIPEFYVRQAHASSIRRDARLLSTGGVQYLRRTEAETGVAMKPVVQLDRTGCGIASVAALAGVSYRQARLVANRLGIFAGDSRLWSATHHVRRLLKEYGIRSASTEVPFTSWEALPDLALVAVKWHKERDRSFWHWVVFWRGPCGPVVLDSKRALRRHARTDFGRVKVKWFIPVSPI